MTVPTDARFTPEQSARLAEIEASPDAEESLRERVARAIYDSDFLGLQPWSDEPEMLRDEYRANADAALAVIAGTP